MLDGLIEKVQTVSLVLLLVLTGGSWLIMSWSFAQSVLVGGVIAIASFAFGRRDVGVFLPIFVRTGKEKIGPESKEAKKGKAGLIIKFWLRLLLIGVALLLFIRSGRAEIVGLLLGLSIVVFAIMLTTVRVAERYFLRR